MILTKQVSYAEVNTNSIISGIKGKVPLAKLGVLVAC